MTTVTVSGFKIRKGERLYGTYVRYALYKATKPCISPSCTAELKKCTSWASKFRSFWSLKNKSRRSYDLLALWSFKPIVHFSYSMIRHFFKPICLSRVFIHKTSWLLLFGFLTWKALFSTSKVMPGALTGFNRACGLALWPSCTPQHCSMHA